MVNNFLIEIGAKVDNSQVKSEIDNIIKEVQTKISDGLVLKIDKIDTPDDTVAKVGSELKKGLESGTQNIDLRAFENSLKNSISMLSKDLESSLSNSMMSAISTMSNELKALSSISTDSKLLGETKQTDNSYARILDTITEIEMKLKDVNSEQLSIIARNKEFESSIGKNRAAIENTLETIKTQEGYHRSLEAELIIKNRLAKIDEEIANNRKQFLEGLNDYHYQDDTKRSDDLKNLADTYGFDELLRKEQEVRDLRVENSAEVEYQNSLYQEQKQLVDEVVRTKNEYNESTVKAAEEGKELTDEIRRTQENYNTMYNAFSKLENDKTSKLEEEINSRTALSDKASADAVAKMEKEKAAQEKQARQNAELDSKIEFQQHLDAYKEIVNLEKQLLSASGEQKALYESRLEALREEVETKEALMIFEDKSYEEQRRMVEAKAQMMKDLEVIEAQRKDISTQDDELYRQEQIVAKRKEAEEATRNIVKITGELSQLESEKIASDGQRTDVIRSQIQAKEQELQVAQNLYDTNMREYQTEQQLANIKEASARRQNEASLSGIKYAEEVTRAIVEQEEAISRATKAQAQLSNQMQSTVHSGRFGDSDREGLQGLIEQLNKINPASENAINSINRLEQSYKDWQAAAKHGYKFEDNIADSIKLQDSNEAWRSYIANIMEVDEAHVTLTRNAMQRFGEAGQVIQDFQVAIKSNEGTERFKTQITEWADSAGEVNSNLRILDKSFTETSASSNFFADGLQQIITRFISLHAAIRLIRSSVDYLFEVDDALNQIRITTGYAEADVKRLGQEYSNLAQRMSVSTREVLSTAVDYFRQGLDEFDVATNMEEAIKFSKIASVDLGHSIEMITAAVNSMNESASKVVDTYSFMGDATATSLDEIGVAMQKTGATANALGIELEKVSSWIATLSSKTRESAQIVGTSINRILSRMQNLKQTGYANIEEGDYTSVNDVAKSLAKANIDLIDQQTGVFRETQVVMDELGASWKDLDYNTQRYIATTLAGAMHQSRFLALMDGYSDSVKLYNQSLLASGTANEKFAIWQESSEAAVEKFNATWQNMVNSFADTSTITNFVNTGTRVLEFFGSLESMIFSVASAMAIFKAEGIAQAFGLGNTTISSGLDSLQEKGTKIQKFINSISLGVSSGNISDFKASLTELSEVDISSGFELGSMTITSFIGVLGKLGIAYQVVTGIMKSYYAEKKREREEAIRLMESTLDEIDSLNTLAEQYEIANEQYEGGLISKEEYNHTTDIVKEKLGEEGVIVKDLSDNYQELKGALDNVISSKTALPELLEGLSAINDEIKEILLGNWLTKLKGESGSINIDTSSLQDFKDILSDIDGTYLNIIESSDGTEDVSLLTFGDFDYTDINQLTDVYGQLEQALDGVIEKGLQDTDVGQKLVSTYNNLTPLINKQAEAQHDLDQAIVSNIASSEDFNAANVNSRSTLQNFQRDLIQVAQESSHFAGRQNEARDAVIEFIGTSDKFQDFIVNVDDAGNSISNLADKTTTLKESTKDLNEIKSIFLEAQKELHEMNQKDAEYTEFSLELLNQISETYEDLAEYVYLYLLGMIEENELIELLNEKYLESATVHHEATQERMMDSEEYYDYIIEKEAEVFESLAEQYELDLENYRTVNELKRAMASDTHNELMMMNAARINEEAEAAGVDLSNFYDAEADKVNIKALVNAIMTGQSNEYVEALLLNYIKDENGFIDKQRAKETIMSGVYANLTNMTSAEVGSWATIYAADVEEFIRAQNAKIDAYNQFAEGVSSNTFGADWVFDDGGNPQYRKSQKMLHDAISNDLKKIDPVSVSYSPKGGGGGKKKGGGGKGSGGKSGSDAVVDAFKEAYEELKHQRDMDLISESEYYAELQSLYEKHYKGKSEYVKEARKIELELYNGIKKVYDEEAKQLKHGIFLSEKNDDTEAVLRMNEDILRLTHETANMYREMGYDESHDIIQKLQSDWWSAFEDREKYSKQYLEDIVKDGSKAIKLLNEDIDDIEFKYSLAGDESFSATQGKTLETQSVINQKYEIAKQKLEVIESVTDKIVLSTDAYKEALRSAKDEVIDMNKEVKDIEEERLKNEDALIQNAIDLMKEKIDLYNEEIDKIKEKYKVEIDLIDNQIKALKDKWDKEDEALDREKERNDELEFQKQQQERLLEIEKLREKLANVRQEKNIQSLKKQSDGSWGFEYIADQDEIDSLLDDITNKQKEYDDAQLKHEQDKRDKLRQMQRDYELDALNSLKANLEEQRDSEIKYYDNQIKDLRAIIGDVERMLKRHHDGRYNDLNTLLNDIQNLESDKYTERLMELERYVNDWNSLVARMRQPTYGGQADGSSSIQGANSRMASPINMGVPVSISPSRMTINTKDLGIMPSNMTVGMPKDTASVFNASKMANMQAASRNHHLSNSINKSNQTVYDSSTHTETHTQSTNIGNVNLHGKFDNERDLLDVFDKLDKNVVQKINYR